AVFIGGWTLEAAEAVCPPDGDREILDNLASLLDMSLLRAEEEPGGTSRFRMLETIREYAAERLEQSGEAEVLRRRHAQHYLTLTEAGHPELLGPQQVAWLHRLAQEHDNLRAAMGWAIA